MLAGYRVNASSSDVAKIAVERNDVSICRSILNIGFLVPTSWESRVHCVHEYASITKDPTACKGIRLDALMSCVGAATERQPCLFMEKTLRWNDGKFHEISFESCTEEKSENGSACCKIARAKFEADFDLCDSLNVDNKYTDQCWNEVAIKKSDASFCSNIKSENLWSACTMHINTSVHELQKK